MITIIKAKYSRPTCVFGIFVRFYTCSIFLLQDRRAEVMLLVGPKCGISQVTDIKSFTVSDCQLILLDLWVVSCIIRLLRVVLEHL